jgi:hypothetical protein
MHEETPSFIDHPSKQEKTSTNRIPYSSMQNTIPKPKCSKKISEISDLFKGENPLTCDPPNEWKCTSIYRGGA